MGVWTTFTLSRIACTLLDVHLPDDVVDLVLHMLSKLSSHVYLLWYVNPGDLQTVLGASDRLRSAALRKFTCLEMCPDARTSPCLRYVATFYKLKCEAPVIFVELESLLVALLTAFGG